MGSEMCIRDRDLGVNRATVSLLVALALLIHAVFGLPGGVIAGRFGAEKVYLLAWILVGMSAFSSFAENFATLLVLRLAYGIGFGLIIPTTAPILIRWMKPREITVMNGLDIAALTLGVAVSVTTVAPISEEIGWKNALSVFGTVALLGAVAWAFLGKAQCSDGQQVSEKRITLNDISNVLRNRIISVSYTHLTLPTICSV